MFEISINVKQLIRIFFNLGKKMMGKGDNFRMLRVRILKQVFEVRKK